MLTKRNLETLISWGKLLNANNDVVFTKWDVELLQKLHFMVGRINHENYKKK